VGSAQPVESRHAAASASRVMVFRVRLSMVEEEYGFKAERAEGGGGGA